MNIRGTAGLSPADIQSEIARGARFVAYQWCLSLGVITLKRVSRIHYLRPGQSGFAPCFLWSLFSLVGGWWGIPWGPVYTLGALWTNLRGGIDVTAAVSADLGSAGAPAEPKLTEAAAGRRWNPGALAAVGALVAGILGVLAYHQIQDQQHRPVALANGLDHPYSVEIDGVSRPLRAHSVEQIDLPAGSHHAVATLPGGNGTTEFEFDVGRATVVNPDGAALVAEETVYYSNQTNPTGKNPDPTFYTGQTDYSLEPTDYFLTEFPESVSMPSAGSRVAKRRLAVYAELSLARVAEIIEAQSGHGALVAHLTALGRRLPADERLLDLATEQLSPEEARAFFDLHRDTRPVIVEWHRAYQNLVRQAGTELEQLRADYRRLAEADPDDGALAYLYGRLLDDPVKDTRWFERALAAERPCPYAHFALAYNAEIRGDYADALARLDQARAAGLDNDTVRDQRIECLTALGRPAEALKVLRERPGPRVDFAHTNAEFGLAYLAGGQAATKQVVDRLLARLSADERKQSGDDIRTSFAARLAYFEGDAVAFGESIPDKATGFGAVTRAICLGDLATAAEQAAATEATGQRIAYLLLYIAAKTGRQPRAEEFWAQALDAWSQAGDRFGRLAAHFTGEASLAPAEILDLPVSNAEKRIILAAVGLHEPALREAAFARARLCNFDPDFPRHLISAALATGETPAAPESL